MAATASPLTIILATVIPFLFVLIFVLVLWRCARKRSYALFNRGITPIADEEIESWKNDRNRSIDDSEKEPIPEPLVRGHTRGNSSNGNNVIRKSDATVPSKKYHQKQQSSVSSMTTKPPSVIVYQNAPTLVPRPSEEMSRSAGGKYSMELPQTPVLARAPNARPGLTDDAVQGDEPFIPQLKRQPSRLSKAPGHPPAHALHQRHKSAYGAIGASNGRGDRWYGSQPQDFQSRKSADHIPRRGTTSGRGHERIYSATANPPRRSLDDASPGGLTPRPLLHKSEIGRAIG